MPAVQLRARRRRLVGNHQSGTRVCSLPAHFCCTVRYTPVMPLNCEMVPRISLTFCLAWSFLISHCALLNCSFLLAFACSRTSLDATDRIGCSELNALSAGSCHDSIHGSPFCSNEGRERTTPSVLHPSGTSRTPPPNPTNPSRIWGTFGGWGAGLALHLPHYQWEIYQEPKGFHRANITVHALRTGESIL